MSILILRSSVASVQSAPAWFVAQTEKTWNKILDAEDFEAVVQTPEPSVGNSTGSGIIVGNYCGGTVDPERGELILAANGGHSDYSGNEVYALLVKSETPTWYRLTDRTPDDDIDYTNVGSNVRVDYDDGLPRAMHSWNVPAFAEGFGKVYYAYTTDYSAPNSGNSMGAWSFDRDRCGDNYGAFPIAYATVAANGGDGDGYWEYLGIQLDPIPADVEGSEACWDSHNEQVLGFVKIPTGSGQPNQTAWGIDPTDDSTTLYNVVPASGTLVIQWARVATNTTPPVAVVSDYNSTDIGLLDLTNLGTAKFVVKTTSGSTAYDGSAGWYPVWHEPSKAFLLADPRGNTTNVVKLTPSDPDDPLNATWTFSTITAVGGGDTPASNNAPRWSRFNLIPDMGNGQGALIAVDNTGAYVYKLPAGALS